MNNHKSPTSDSETLSSGDEAKTDLRSVISQVGKLLQEKRATQGTNSYDVLDLEVALERLKIVDDRERQYTPLRSKNHKTVVVAERLVRRAATSRTRFETGKPAVTPTPTAHDLLVPAPVIPAPVAPTPVTPAPVPSTPITQTPLATITVPGVPVSVTAAPVSTPSTQVNASQPLSSQPSPTKLAKGRKYYYAIIRGLEVGVYDSWTTVGPFVSQIPGNIHRRFDTLQAARNWYNAAEAQGLVEVVTE